MNSVTVIKRNPVVTVDGCLVMCKNILKFQWGLEFSSVFTNRIILFRDTSHLSSFSKEFHPCPLLFLPLPSAPLF